MAKGTAGAGLRNALVHTRLLRACRLCRAGRRANADSAADHAAAAPRVEMRIVGAPPQATCAWVFDEGEGAPRNYTGPCGEEVRIRLLYGKTTNVTVDVSVPNSPPLRATEQVVVRDLLIAGLGDS